jgi:hypothetical protein
VNCDRDHEPDLFWGLRGAGGGQFGVVTSLRFDTVPEPLTTRIEAHWFFDAIAARVGAVVAGRTTYEHSGHWGGGGPHPTARLFVLSRRPAPEISEAQTLVTTGIEDAIAAARAAAGDKDVALMGGGVLTSALEAGLVDEVIPDLGHEVVVTAHRRTEVPSFLAGRVTVEAEAAVATIEGFQAGYVTIAGLPTWHEVRGEGPAVVLLHGAFSGAAVSVPALMLQGDRDEVTLEHGAAVAAALADGRLAVLPGTHGLPIEVPELVNTLLISFLRGAVPAPAWAQPGE